MKKFVFIAAVLGFTNVFVAMTQQKNSPIPLHNTPCHCRCAGLPSGRRPRHRIIAIMVVEGLPLVL